MLERGFSEYGSMTSLEALSQAARRQCVQRHDQPCSHDALVRQGQAQVMHVNRMMLHNSKRCLKLVSVDI